MLHLIREQKALEAQSQRRLGIPYATLLPRETTHVHSRRAQVTSRCTQAIRASSQPSPRGCTCVKRVLQCPHLNEWEVSLFFQSWPSIWVTMFHPRFFREGACLFIPCVTLPNVNHPAQAHSIKGIETCSNASPGSTANTGFSLLVSAQQENGGHGVCL